MNILYIHQYFSTLNGATGTRSYEFSRRWIKAGHNVVMLTTGVHLSEDDLRNSTGYFIKQTIIDGIDVRAVNLPYNQKMGFIKRSCSFIAFVIVASICVLFVKKPDVIYASSTPLTVGIPAVIAKCLRRIPFVFEVRDQWPEIPIELGIIKNRIFVKFLLWLEKTIYKNSSAIIACSPGQADGIKNVCSSKPLTVIPNSCDIDTFSPAIDGSKIRQKYGWQNKLVFLHAGAMGKVNNLRFIVDAAEKLKANKDVLFVLIGQGREKAALEKRVAELSLGNVQILPPAPKHTLPNVFAAVDVGLVIIGNYPIIQHNSANKFFDSLSAGKPVLLNYSGWQRELLEAAKAGFGCELCNLDEFVKKILYLDDNRDLLPALGNNARKLALEQFNRDKLAIEALHVIETVMQSQRLS